MQSLAVPLLLGWLCGALSQAVPSGLPLTLPGVLPVVFPPADIAFAAPPAPEGGAELGPGCAAPCYVVKDYHPFRSCAAVCDPQVCDRGYGVYRSKDICCAPGVAFPEGCSRRPTQCWVVESFQLRTCIRDDRKCLQGFGVFPSVAACCAPGAAFPEGCNATVPVAPQPCWVVDSYYPARLCRPSRILCDKESSGVQSWTTKEECCAIGSGAFGEGCSVFVPQAPCYVIDSYYPSQTCRLETDIAVCNRGWGVFQNLDVCCSPGAAFQNGCSGAQVPAAAAEAAAAAAAAPPPQPLVASSAEQAVAVPAPAPAVVVPAALVNPQATTGPPVVASTVPVARPLGVPGAVP